MKKQINITLLLLLMTVFVTAQKQEDVQGLVQISKQYSYIGIDDELYKQVVDMGPSIKILNTIKEKYAVEIAQNPNDSISILYKQTDKNLMGFKANIDSRFPINQISSKIIDYLGDAMRGGNNSKILKEDPDNQYTWWNSKKRLEDARLALEILRLAKGESDTAYVNNLARIKKCEDEIDLLKKETRALLPPKKPIAPLPELYKGADKEALRAKVKALFNSECDKYSIKKVFIVSENWTRTSGIRWDDFTKSFIKFDHSTLEIDVICVKKSEVNPTSGYLVSYSLEKDNISGKVYDTVLCDYLEDKPIPLNKVK